VPIRAALTQESPQASLSVEAVNRRGKRARIPIQVTPVGGAAAEIRGAIVLMGAQLLETGF